MSRFISIFLFICLALSLVSPAYAAEKSLTPEYTRKLVIVSSFPKAMGVIYKAAFESRNPGVEVKVLKKKTSAGLKYLYKLEAAKADKSTDDAEIEDDVDLFWVSAPDAFEVLKKKKMLQKYIPKAEGIPRRLSGFPVNDPEGYYSGFSGAGYGLMWNTEYLKAHNLPEPREWVDLTRPEFHGHVGLSAPSRSGTTHLTVESILQLLGWEAGWSLVKGIGGNAKTITQKSSHVPKGVIKGEFGVGIVIDYYGLTAIANGHPVGFAYPGKSVFVPANIGILKASSEPELAGEFIEFVLSPEGQKLLLEADISRLPIRPELYQPDSDGITHIPEFYPHPFSAKQLGAHVAFDVKRSRERYNVVNSLFDVMITYRLEDLQTAISAIQDAEASLISTSKPQPALAGATNLARDLLFELPVDELTSIDPHFASIFRKKRKKVEDIIEGEQAEIEAKWDELVAENYLRVKAVIGKQLLKEVSMADKVVVETE